MYINTFDAPGVTYEAAPFSADTEAEAHNFGLSSGCANEEMRPYNDGVFVGSHLVYTQCGAEGDAEFHVIAANPQNQGFTALLRIQITGPQEAPLVDAILSTVGTVATGPAPSAPATLGAPATTVPAPAPVTAPVRRGSGHPDGRVAATVRSGPRRLDDARRWCERRSASRFPARGRRASWHRCRTRTARRNLGSRRRQTKRCSSRPRALRTRTAFPVPSTGRIPSSRTSPTCRRRWTTPTTTASARRIRCRRTTTARSSGTSSRSTAAAVRQLASSSSSPTPGSERRTRWCSSSS